MYWQYPILNVAMAAMHKKDWGGDVSSVKTGEAYFYCSGSLNSSDLKINENIMLEEHLMLDHTQRI